MDIVDEINYSESGLVPVVAQDFRTGEVLMLAYMNKDALEMTISTGKVHYFSRSRGKLWLKGETSGHYQQLMGLYYDCDMDALLVKVEQTGPACHTEERSCFYREIDTAFTRHADTHSVIDAVYAVIRERKSAPKEGSYVSSLFSEGTDKILKKIGEESAELIISSKNKIGKDIVHETADVWFHVLVLLAHLEISPEDIYRELGRRFGISGLEEKKNRTKT